MKKRLFLMLALTVMVCCFFALSVSAATTNEFGTVETSDKIDLTGMSTDTNARVVLFDGTEYHTYPSQYIVTSAGDITLNFDKINEAFGKSYSTANNSVIRIEIPNTVKVIVSGCFNYGKNNNLKEVYFPADSQVYKWNWGCFEANKGLEKINIPASLTEYHGTNHFAQCSSLKYVTFDEGYSVSYIPTNFFQSCSSLETIVFPNCVTEVRGGAFGSCAKLKTIIFGNSLQTMGGSMSDCATGGSVWYLPASFYSKDVTSEPPSTMFHWAGYKTDGDSGNNNNPKNITFVYTGTREEALALQARFKAADAATGENCVGLKRLWDAVLCTEAEYKELTGKNIGEVGAKGYYLVYGYNKCDAFYGGEHAEGQVLNSCQFGCGRNCGKVELLENPQHNLNISESLGESGYFGTICIKESCTVCNTVTFSEDIDPMFESLGYSACTFGEGFSITQGFKVNSEAMGKYKTHVADFYFGMLATVNNAGEAYAPSLDSENVVANRFDTIVNDYIDIKVKGIPADKGDALVVLCAYVNAGGKTYYLDAGISGETVVGISYNEANN